MEEVWFSSLCSFQNSFGYSGSFPSSNEFYLFKDFIFKWFLHSLWAQTHNSEFKSHMLLTSQVPLFKWILNQLVNFYGQSWDFNGYCVNLWVNLRRIHIFILIVLTHEHSIPLFLLRYFKKFFSGIIFSF